MKKKFLLALLSLVLVLFCAFGFAACGIFGGAMLTSIAINAGAKNNVGAKAFVNTANPTWI